MTERAERREKRRLIDARFPQIKRLEDFRFADNPKIPQATIAATRARTAATKAWRTSTGSLLKRRKNCASSSWVGTALLR